MDAVSIRAMEQEGIQMMLDASFQAARRDPRGVEIVQKPSKNRDYRTGALLRMPGGDSPLYDSLYCELGQFVDVYC